MLMHSYVSNMLLMLWDMQWYRAWHSDFVLIEQQQVEWNTHYVLDRGLNNYHSVNIRHYMESV